MNPTLTQVLLAGITVYFIVIVYLLKQNSLMLKYTLLWLLFGIIMLFMVIFPRSLIFISNLIGIYEPMNALFATCFFCLILIIMSLTSIVSRLRERNKKLAQNVALLEERVRSIEKR